MVAHSPGQKVSLTWADVLLLTLILLLCMGAWIGGERLVAPAFLPRAPSKDSLEAQRQVPTRRAELAAAERNLAVREQRLREQRLEDMRHRAVTAAYETLYPEVRGIGARAAPPEVRSGYLNARMVVSATQGYLQALQKDVARQDSAVARARAALGAAERAASDSLRKALKEHTSRRRGLNFVCGLVLALVAFGTLWVAAPWLARRLEVPLHPGLAFGVGGAVLLVLVAHHLLRWTGALGVVSLLALGWLAHAVRHHPRPAPGTEGQR